VKRKYSGIFVLIFCLGPCLAVIIAHENVRALVSKDQTLMGGQTKALPANALPGVTELKAFRDMLSDSTDLVRRQMKAGKTLDAIKAAGLPEKLAPWANGFLKAPQWLELVYRSLKNEVPQSSLEQATPG